MPRPNFLIVGAAKAGTTALYRYLSQHPQIFMSADIKETFFFSGITREMYPHPTGIYAADAITDLQSYLALFDHARQNQMTGEACVAYLYFYEQSIKNITSVLGNDCKIIISLRHPVERAYSNYLHHLRDGFETVSFETALELEESRKRDEWWWGFQYQSVSMYYDQVIAYFDSFPQRNIKVILNEDLSSSPQSTLDEIFDFLGVDNARIDTSIRFNTSGVPANKLVHYLINKQNPLRWIAKALLSNASRQNLRTSKLINRIKSKNYKKPAIPEDVRRQLCSQFLYDTKRLSCLIKKDIAYWRK